MQNTSAWFSRHFRIAKIQQTDDDFANTNSSRCRHCTFALFKKPHHEDKRCNLQVA